MTDPSPVDGIARLALATARSWLFVPGDRPERFDKAAASGADMIICDLEDAVSPAAKGEARDQVSDWLGGNSACVRINAAGTDCYDEDVRAIGATAGVCAVMVPKSEDPELLAELAGQLPSRVAIIALVETALGIARAMDIAAVPGVLRLAFGSLDYLLDISAEGGTEALLLPRSTLVLASRVAHKPAPIDGVTTALQDPGVLDADITEARALGLAAKLCIHPSQVASVNARFGVTSADLEWAHRVLAAVADGAGAAALDGKLVDKPVIDRAQRILHTQVVS